MKTTPLCRRNVLLFFTAAALGPGPLPAANRFWITPEGGSFGSTANWSLSDGGAGGASVPVAADVANFTLNNTYTVALSGAATNTDLDVENGNVTLDLGSFTYTVTSLFAVAVGNVAGQTGRLTLREGTIATDSNGDNVDVGNVTGGIGFLTVTTSGRIGNGTLRPSVTCGRQGTGSLTVNDTGRIDGFALTVGDSAGSGGAVTFTGPNAVGNFSTTSTIGGAGAGVLTVSNGGTLTTTPGTTLGESLGSDGTATVTGPGSSWTMGQLSVGSSGDGTLTVSAGGLVINSGNVNLGNIPTGFGTATVSGSGSRWQQATQLTVGAFGLGVLTVSSGGEVISGAAAALGAQAGSEGRATVTGVESLWSIGNGLTVGNLGTGDLLVSAGGEVVSSTVALGSGVAGIGTATITGAGSKLTMSGSLTVASSSGGGATFTAANGGAVYAGANVLVNDPAGGPVGTLHLNGGSLYVDGNFTNGGIFTFADGLLRVAGNCQPTAAPVHFVINGSDSDDLPTLDLIGSGTTTNVIGITIGSNRRGQLHLRQGRVLSTGANPVALGGAAGGEGILSVESGALLLSTGSVEVGGTVGGVAAGKGTLNVAGGTVDIATLELFRDGTVNLSSGTLAVDTIPVFDGQFNWTGGMLRFDTGTTLTGTTVPKLLGLDATLDAGQVIASTASLTLQTPLTVDGGALNTFNLINQSRLEIRSGFLGNVQNEGVLTGDGIIAGAVTNTASGRIRVDDGDTLTFLSAPPPNAGQLNLQGGTLDFTGAITNSASGFITGRGALYTAGLTNNGQMAFSGGTMDIFGDVTLTAGSRVVTSGAGSVTTFWDDVLHNGTEIYTGAQCSTVFFGSQSGGGAHTGSGTEYFIGDLRPGNSPAIVRYAPQVVLAPSHTLTLDIGGQTAGAEHDKLIFTHAGTPQVEWDGTLVLELTSGFTPAAGQSFDVFDFDAARDAGAFSNIIVLDRGTLPPGLAFDFGELYTTGIIRVISTTGLTFAEWAATVLGDAGALPSGDHNHNGYDNATEFALGLFPPHPGTIEPNGGLHTYADGERLRMLFTRPLDRTGVTLKVQASSDLLTWSDLAVSIDSAPFTGAGFVSENRAHPLSEPGLVEVRDIVTTPAGARRYVRIQVTLSP